MGGMVDAALALHGLGFSVFPLRPKGKKPCEPWEDFQRERAEIEKISNWWRKYPNANPAVACGPVSGVFVVDVDGDLGAATMAELQREHGAVPITWRVRTGKGEHLYFRWPADRTFGNGRGKLKHRGVDIRGDGGYVVGAGAVHESGRTYEWDVDGDPRFTEIADCPPWLLDLIDPPKANGTPKPNGSHPAPRYAPAITETAGEFPPAYVDAAMRDAFSEVSGAPEGSRNETLYGQAFALFTLALAGAVSEQSVRSLMEAAGANAGLDDAEIGPTIASALKGAKEAGPRKPPEPRTARQAQSPPADHAPGPDAPVEPQERESAAAAVQPDPPKVGQFSDWTAIGDDIPPRRWIVQGRLLRGEVGVLVAPGGTGKSSFDILTGLACATGIELTGEEIKEVVPVWIINNEDSTNELRRRTMAAIIHHGIDPARIGDRLMVTGADGQILRLFESADRMPKDGPNIETVIQLVEDAKIGVVILDPLASLHFAEENDNAALDHVLRGIGRIARATNCAVTITHHTRKAGAGLATDSHAGNLDNARGASAIVYAARFAHTLATMTDALADELGVPRDKRTRYVRLNDAKSNYSAMDPRNRWFERQSVELPNGDEAVALALWKPVDVFSSVTPAMLAQVQEAIAASPPMSCRADRRAAKWVGNIVGTILGRDPLDDGQAVIIDTIIRTWVTNGALRKAHEPDPKNGRKVPVIRVGKIARP